MVVAGIAALATLQLLFLFDTQSALHAAGPETADFGFAEVFPRPFWQTAAFNWALLGLSLVVAGTISYFTAGAGAPAAATGVSTVASTIAGGGAGSYMAGLSIVGGWFGGNAMLGSAILNGIVIGLGGGGTAFASMSAIGKAGVLASMTATALDGVLLFQSPKGGGNLIYRVRLVVPERIGSSELRSLVEDLNETDEGIVKRTDKLQRARADNADADDIQEIETELGELVNTRNRLTSDARARAANALQHGASAEDLLVLAVLSKNSDQPQTFVGLLRKIPDEALTNRSYLDYLNGVVNVESGKLNAAVGSLKRSWGASPYAIEPALLLVNIYAHKNGIAKNEAAIRETVERAEEQFDAGEYVSGYSLTALYYRVGTIFYNGKRYKDAQGLYQKAYDDLPMIQKYFGAAQIGNLIRLGIANSLYAQGQTQPAQELLAEILDDADSDAERENLRAQFIPNVPSRH